jgi:hypothetical protein
MTEEQNRNGGVNFNADMVNIGGDVIGRDKIIAGGDYVGRDHIITNIGTFVECERSGCGSPSSSGCLRAGWWRRTPRTSRRVCRWRE